VPANVQVTTGDAIVERGAQTLTDFLSRELAGVHTTHVQNNPFQPDVAYRGFVSSFLLGTPSGLSVFVDGVRVNEPLADQVNWDLIPSDAIAHIELHPGSNPVYGRNTLGGAFVVQTKRGFTHPGTLIETWGGSFGRWRSLLQTGGSRGPVDYFLSGNFFTEEGFRDFSRSEVGQVFGKVGYVEGADDLTLSFTSVNNRLTGNGPLPESRLRRDRSAVFTHPDRFVPDLRFLNGEYQRELAPGLLLAVNAYGRLLDVEQFNRDVEEDVQADTRQRGWGSAIQLSYQGSLFGLPLTTVVGADYSGARLDHRIAEREDNDADDEMETRTLAHEEPDGFEPATKVRTYTHGGGAFLTATLHPLERLAVTASARVDVTDLRLKDHLAENDDDLSAGGSHRFTRVDPAVGATYTLTPRLNLYAGYSQGYRAPTAIELTCANPEAPCPIPTAIVDDPPLDPVKGKTWEAGIRWALLSDVHATLAVFRTDLKDDILFRNEPESRVLGFFQNVDATRRQGVELSLQRAWSRGRWFVNYTLTEATFEDDIDLFTFANADRVAHVQKGDRLPLVPTHRLNGGVEFALSPHWQLSFDGIYVGSQHLRGDEANQRGQLEPYFVANAQVTYQAKHYEFFLRCENLFDNDYESYGAFFDNTLDGTGVERFLSPGPPFGVFAGARLRF
jgi:outer membrane receptor protein involved in Fe transport